MFTHRYLSTSALVVLLLLSVAIIAISSAHAVNEDLHVSTSPNVVSADEPLPGTNYMLSGFDTRKMESKAENKEKHVKNLLFAPTYQFNNKFHLPNTTHTYKQPDQVTAYSYVVTNQTTSSSLHLNVKESLKYASYGFHIKIGASIGNFGISAGLKSYWGHIHYLYKQKFIMTAQGKIYGTVYQTTLEPPQFFKKNPYFKKALDAVPTNPKSKSDLNKVKTLVNYFGEVFPTKINFGGLYHTVTTLKRNILNTYNKSWVYFQLNLQFRYEAFKLSPGGFVNRSQIHISKDFKNHSQTETFFLGGNRAYQSNDKLDKWYGSVAASPAIVGGEFKSVAELVFNDPVKQKNLRAILEHYANTGKFKPASASLPITFNGKQYRKIQGYDIVGGGIDTLTMQPKLNVFKSEFTKGTTWTNPIYKNITWAVPDSLNVINHAESYYSNATYIALSKSEYQHKYKSHSSSSSFFGLCHHTRDVFLYNYRFDFEDEYQYNQFRRISWYDLQLNPIYTIAPESHLDPYFKQFVDSLPVGDASSSHVKEAYRELIDWYGTAIVTRTTMGGGLFYKIRFHKDLTKLISIHDVAEQSSWSFLGLFSGGSTSKKFLNLLNKNFTEHSTVEFHSEGGFWQPELDKPTGSLKIDKEESSGDGGVMSWDNFVKTVKDSPMPLDYEVQPIYEVFTDSKKKSIMKTVLNDYLKEQVNKKYPYEKQQ